MDTEKMELMLAPMVRVGTLPMRLLCLDYGANLVFSPEVVDKSIIGCRRLFNRNSKTVDFVNSNDKLIFRTLPREKEKLIFQIGTADPQLAVSAALTVVNDVSGINLNCGCPKRFSIQGGMGAALLSNKSKLLSILDALVKHVPLPISCKIRLCPTIEETLDLCREITKIGVSFIVIHCRTPSQTVQDKGNWEALKILHERLKENIKIVLNGDFLTLQAIHSFSEFKSVMIARAAMYNPSIFLRSDILLNLYDVSQSYLQYALATHNPFNNSKFTLLAMWEANNPTGNRIVASKSYESLCEIFNIQCIYNFETLYTEPLDYIPTRAN